MKHLLNRQETLLCLNGRLNRNVEAILDYIRNGSVTELVFGLDQVLTLKKPLYLGTLKKCITLMDKTI